MSAKSVLIHFETVDILDFLVTQGFMNQLDILFPEQIHLVNEHANLGNELAQLRRSCAADRDTLHDRIAEATGVPPLPAELGDININVKVMNRD